MAYLQNLNKLYLYFCKGLDLIQTYTDYTDKYKGYIRE